MCITIGISGGHTRSQAIATCGLDVIGTAATDGINDHVSMDSRIDAQNRLLTGGTLKLLSQLVVSIQQSGVFLGKVTDYDDLCRLADQVVIAMPGVTTQFDRDRILFPLNKSFNFNSLSVVDDTWAVMIAGLRALRGVSAIAGTGASVYLGVDEFRLDKRFKLDGFGAILGDWGSGFRLAVRLLEEAGRAHDGLERIALADKLVECANRLQPTEENRLLDSLDNLQNWFDDLVRNEPTKWRTKIAQLATIVTVAADTSTGCLLSRQLVEESSRQLAKTIQTGFVKLRSLEDVVPADLEVESMPVICKGGQLENSCLYYRTLVSELHDLGIEGRVVLSEFGPAVGAAILAISEHEKILIKPDSPQLNIFCESVRTFSSSVKHGLHLQNNHG